MHAFRLTAPAQIDGEFRSWLAEAYYVGAQKHLQRRTKSEGWEGSEMQLYETHLPVADTEKSAQFYREVVELQFAYRDPTRDIVFLWVGNNRKSMLGLWGPMTLYGKDRHHCHFAIALSLSELLHAGSRLNSRGVATRNFAGEETTEPSVIGWMPSAQLYFRDPDGHSIEFIALLNEPPKPNFVGSLAAWRKS